MVPDYQLEDTKRQAAFEKSKQEPKEHCFKCGKEIEPEELIEYYDLAFCSQGCIDRAMECPECGEQAEEVGGYCPGCAEKNRIYTMAEDEYWQEVYELIDRLPEVVIRDFQHRAGCVELTWASRHYKPIGILIKLFESRGIHYVPCDWDEIYKNAVTIQITFAKYREI